jgi:hypothetical protein
MFVLYDMLYDEALAYVTAQQVSNFFFFLVVLEIKLKALHILSKPSVPVLCFLKTRSHYVAQLASNLRSYCHSLSSARITGSAITPSTDFLTCFPF